MSGKAGLKAGLIGAGALFLITLPNLLPTFLPPIPCLGCICCGLPLLAYAGVGVLAGFFITPPRDAGAGAGAGAIAGLISAVGSTIAWMITMGLQMLISGTQDVMSTLDPEMIRQISELGISPEMFAALSGVTGLFIAGGMCCLVSLALGAGLGALGGLIFGATKPD